MWKITFLTQNFRSIHRKRISSVLGSFLNLNNMWPTERKPAIFAIYIYVTLSHLRSKEFQRIHKSCIPHHIEMYPGKVVALPKVKPLSSKQGLLWCGSQQSVDFIQTPVKIDCGIEFHTCGQIWLWYWVPTWSSHMKAFQCPCYSKSLEKVI